MLRACVACVRLRGASVVWAACRGMPRKAKSPSGCLMRKLGWDTALFGWCAFGNFTCGQMPHVNLFVPTCAVFACDQT
eukprot:3645783-Prymnesium_polylepis.1